jgi:hypothetical protein
MVYRAAPVRMATCHAIERTNPDLIEIRRYVSLSDGPSETAVGKHCQGVTQESTPTVRESPQSFRNLIKSTTALTKMAYKPL